MDNITFTASADSTPPANTVVATKQFGGGEHAQEIILADVDENFFSASGFGASPIVTIVSNLLSASIASGSMTVDKINLPVSASISSGSLGSVEKINTPVSASISSGSITVDKVNLQVSASIAAGTINNISNQISASVSAGSITVDKVNLVVSTSVAGGSVALLAGVNAIGIASVIQQVTSGWSLSSIYNQVSASISAGSITVDKINDRVSASISGGSITVDKVNLQVSASVSGGSLAILAGVNAIGIASVIQQVTDGWSLSSIYNVVSASIGSGSLGSVDKINTPVSASISSGSLGSVEKINTPVSASISSGSITVDKINLQVSASIAAGTINTISNQVSASVSSGSITVDKINLGVSASVSSGSITVDKINLGVSASISNAPSALVSGDLAHDAADAGNPVKVGIRSASFGVKPTAVAHADRSNWYGNVDGIPFVLGGHMAASSKEFAFTTAQNDQALWAASTTNKLVITKAEVTLDEAVTVGVGVRLGFGTNTLSASGTGGASGLVLSHPGLVPGGGITVGDGNGILGAGLNNEAIRFTCEVPTTGAVVVRVTCFEIVA